MCPICGFLKKIELEYWTVLSYMSHMPRTVTDIVETREGVIEKKQIILTFLNRSENDKYININRPIKKDFILRL